MASYQHLTFVDYRDQYHNKGAHTLVDVRTRGEYYAGHLPGAVNIPLHELANRINEVDPEKPVVVVCATGNRSLDGSQILANAGFKAVYNLQGGTMVWMMNGMPLDQ